MRKKEKFRKYEKMKLLRNIGITLLLIWILAFCLNLLGSKKPPPTKEYPPIKDTVNIILSVNWTGSITGIGGSPSTDTHYRKQLKSNIGEELHELIKNLGGDKTLNLSYCIFGLVRSENSGENPDFKTNYIKKFKTNCTSYNRGDLVILSK